MWRLPAMLAILGSAIPAPSEGILQTFQPGQTQPLRFEDCPASCGDVFDKLEGVVQRVVVQERGEVRSPPIDMREPWNELQSTQRAIQQ